METEHKFWKIIGILFIAYIIIWFWPVAFHRPFFNYGSNVVPFDTVSARPDAAPGYVPPSAPDIRFGGDGYEDPAPMPAVPSVPVQQIACTMEAKQCPDGSYVGRQGPNCEFEPCPTN